MSGNYEEIKSMVYYGKDKDYSHVIIICDCFDHTYYPRYISYNESIDEIIDEIKYNYGFGVSMTTVKEIYNYELDLDLQLNERRAYHNEQHIMTKKDIDKAIEFAKIKHKGQFRKNKEPEEYINHPIRVAKLVQNYFENNRIINDYIVVSLLHDTIEDTNTLLEEIESNFSKRIAYLVSELTNEPKQIIEKGKEEYLASKFSNISNTALNIKLCDRLDNIKSLMYTDNTTFINNYINETTYIITSLLTNKKLNKTQLQIINDILNNMNKVIIDSNQKVHKKIITN